MELSILAHGGQMTGDELAIVGGGLSFALLFPVAVLLIAARRSRKRDDPGARDGKLGNRALPDEMAARAQPQPDGTIGGLGPQRDRQPPPALDRTE